MVFYKILKWMVGIARWLTDVLPVHEPWFNDAGTSGFGFSEHPVFVFLRFGATVNRLFDLDWLIGGVLAILLLESAIFIYTVWRLGWGVIPFMK